MKVQVALDDRLFLSEGVLLERLTRELLIKNLSTENIAYKYPENIIGLYQPKRVVDESTFTTIEYIVRVGGKEKRGKGSVAFLQDEECAKISPDSICYQLSLDEKEFVLSPESELQVQLLNFGYVPGVKFTSWGASVEAITPFYKQFRDADAKLDFKYSIDIVLPPNEFPKAMSKFAPKPTVVAEKPDTVLRWETARETETIHVRFG